MNIQITNLDQLENMIKCLGANRGHLEAYSAKKIKHDSDIETIVAILKKCRSMVNDLKNQSESTKEALGWIHGAILTLNTAKGEF